MRDLKEDTVKKIIEGRISPKYDEQYLKSVMENTSLNINFDFNSKARHTFESYSSALKKYTEQKFYSGNQSIEAFIKEVRIIDCLQILDT